MAQDRFTDEELACPCCGEMWFSPAVRMKLSEARELAGIPFVVKAPEGSACRCQKHNKAVGGSATSSHLIEDENGDTLLATAVDIKCTDSRSRFVILEALIKTGFTRIGVAKTFIHVDADETKAQKVCWVY